MIWMAPRPSSTGTNRPMTLRTHSLVVSRLSRTPPSSRRTGTICTPNCRIAADEHAEGQVDGQVALSARRCRDRRRPGTPTTRAAIWATFHTTGATYDRKKRRWLFSTPEAPGRQHEEADAREHDAGQLDREVVLVAGEPRGEHGGQRPGEQDADEADGPGERDQQPGDGAGQPAGLVVATLGPEPGVDGDERGRQDAFAEQVLHQVGDAQRRLERVRRRTRAQEGADDDLADQAGTPGQEDAGGDQHGPARARRRLGRRRGGPPGRTGRFGGREGGLGRGVGRAPRLGRCRRRRCARRPRGLVRGWRRRAGGRRPVVDERLHGRQRRSHPVDRHRRLVEVDRQVLARHPGRGRLVGEPGRLGRPPEHVGRDGHLAGEVVGSVAAGIPPRPRRGPSVGRGGRPPRSR